MATVEIERPDMTVADLAERFGPIPLRRIVLDPPPGEATEDDLAELHERTGRVLELVDGVLVEKPMGVYESWLALRIAFLIGKYLERHDTGFTVGEAGMMRLVAGLVRAPDVSFVNWDRTADRHVPREPVPSLVPTLAVEVLSRSNTQREMDDKLDDYFASGVELVWYVDPPTRTVRVYAGRDVLRTCGVEDALDGGGVLPGFAWTVAELFGEHGSGPNLPAAGRAV